MPVQRNTGVSHACLEGKVSTFHLKDVGIVMIGRNEGERLLRAIEAAKQSCERIVYSDSASTDGSMSRAEKLGIWVISLDDSQPLTAARGRKAGLECLLSKWPDCRFVQFIDGDCILQPGWLETARAFLDANPEVAAVCGRRFEARPEASFYNRLIDREWDTPVGQASECGGDSMMRVAAIESAGSFRADLRAGEEPELCARLRQRNWKIWRLDAPMTEHDADIRHFGQWWGRSERGGFGYAQVWSATRHMPSPLYGRQIASALFWAVGVPTAIICVAAVSRTWWVLSLLPFTYAAQVTRMALRRSGQFTFANRIKAASTTMIIKFAEAKGVSRYWLGMGSTKTSYKSLPPAELSGA